MFGKKKTFDSGLDIPPAPPPVKATEEMALPIPKPEFTDLPDMSSPDGENLPSFEEELEEEENAPPIKDMIKDEVPMPPPLRGMPGAMPPPPGMGLPPMPKMGMPPMSGMGVPPPPVKGGKVPAPLLDDIPPPPGMDDFPQQPIAKYPKLEAPPMPGESPPEMPTFDAVENEISEEESAKPQGPIFIRADNYKYVLDELNVARNTMKESADWFTGIQDISAGSDQAYDLWRLSLEDVERKMLYVDKLLFGR